MGDVVCIFGLAAIAAFVAVALCFRKQSGAQWRAPLALAFLALALGLAGTWMLPYHFWQLDKGHSATFAPGLSAVIGVIVASRFRSGNGRIPVSVSSGWLWLVFAGIVLMHVVVITGLVTYHHLKHS
jgi:hypothetical protein